MHARRAYTPPPPLLPSHPYFPATSPLYPTVLLLYHRKTFLACWCVRVRVRVFCSAVSWPTTLYTMHPPCEHAEHEKAVIERYKSRDDFLKIHKKSDQFARFRPALASSHRSMPPRSSRPRMVSTSPLGTPAPTHPHRYSHWPALTVTLTVALGGQAALGPVVNGQSYSGKGARGFVDRKRCNV